MRKTVSEANKFLRPTLKTVENGGRTTIGNDQPGAMHTIEVVSMDPEESVIPTGTGFSAGATLPTRHEINRRTIIGRFPVATQAEFDALSDAMKDKAVILTVDECPIGSEVKAIECNASGTPVNAHQWIMGANGWKGGSPFTTTPSGDVQFGGAVLGPDGVPAGAILSGNACVGDSLSARYTNGGWYEYLHQLSMQRTRNRGNFAQFGWNLDQMAAQVDQALATHAETIYIMGGTNVRIFPGLGSNLVDALKSAGHYMDILLSKIGRRRKVVILGIPPAAGALITYNADYCEQWNKMLQFIASEWGADFRYQWEHLVDKATGGPDATKFQADMIHPIQYQQKIAADRVIENNALILGCYLPQRDIYQSDFEYFSDPLNLRDEAAGRATGWLIENQGTALLSVSAANSGFGRKQVLDSNGTATSPTLLRYFNAFPKGRRGAVSGRIKMTTTDTSLSAGVYFSIRFLDASFALIQENYIQAPIAAMDGVFYQEFTSPPAFAKARMQMQFIASRPKSVVEFEQVQVYDIDAMMAYRP